MLSLNKISFFTSNIIILILLLNHKNLLVTGQCQGCVDLDVLTFDKLLRKFPYSLIKFDQAYPYGEKHETFGKFAKDFGKKLNDELLFGLVPIKDYGDKDNSEIGQRYSVNKEKYPHVIIFKNTSFVASFPEYLDLNYNNLMKFVRDNSNLYIAADGCIKEFDDFALQFMKTADKSERKKILELTKERSQKNKQMAQVYVLAMERIIKTGNEFIGNEIDRLQKLLKKSISPNKKSEIEQKINIIYVFKTMIKKKDEL